MPKLRGFDEKSDEKRAGLPWWLDMAGYQFSWRGASQGVCGGLGDGDPKAAETMERSWFGHTRDSIESRRGQRGRREGWRLERKRRRLPELEVQAQNIIKEPPRVAVVGGEQGSGVEPGGA